MGLIELIQRVRQGDAAAAIPCKHFRYQHGCNDSVLVAHIAAAQIAAAFFKAENVVVGSAAALQRADLLADEFEAGEYIDRFHAVILGDPLCQRRGDDGLDEHGMSRHSALLRQAGADIVQQQQTDFVAGKENILPCPAAGSHTDAVAVRIGRQHQRCAEALRLCDGKRHGLRNFGIGIGAGGKAAVRQTLFLHHRDIGEAARRQRPQHRLLSRAVQRGIDHGKVPLYA